MSAGRNTRIPLDDPRLIHAPKCRYHPDAIVAIDYNAGHSVCTECGLVVESRLIVETEVAYNHHESDNGHGPPIHLLQDNTEPTTYLRPPQRRLKDGQVFAPRYPKHEPRLLSAYNQIRGVASRMHIPYNVSDYAMVLYKQLRQEPQTRGKYLERTSAAILYIACGHKGCPRPLKEFVKYVASKYSEVSASYRRIAPLLECEDTSNREGVAAAYVPRMCYLLNLPFPVRKLAQSIALKVRQHGLMDGHSPVTVAAGSIYLAAKEMETPRSVADIAPAAYCSARTVRESYKIIKAHRGLLLSGGQEGEEEVAEQLSGDITDLTDKEADPSNA